MPVEKKIPINYTSRDFETIRQSLVEHARRYYPNTYKDFNEASFGSLMIDTVSYVGDVLSFYLDYQANESFLSTASEYKNILRLMNSMGYKFNKAPSSHGICQFFVLVPAKTLDGGPDMNYAPVLRTGTKVSTRGGIQFTLNEDIDFSNSNNDIIVARIDEDNGNPTYYAIKAEGQVISGEILNHVESVSTFEKFKKVTLPGENISEVLSIVDASGNKYYEVENLSQNIIFKKLINENYSQDNVPSVLKSVPAPRRYIVEQSDDDTIITFGGGSSTSVATGSVTDPSMVALKMHGRDYVSDNTFDPSVLISDEKMGIGPANTTLVITYRQNTADNVNAGSNAVNEVSDINIEFKDPINLDGNIRNFVINSIEVTNEDPIVGDVSLPSIEELKTRIGEVYSTQKRAVTKQDYKSMTYAMPASLGAIKRCSVMRDRNSLERDLNLYILSEDSVGNLTPDNITIKNNLKTWLNQSRMINDVVNIRDAKIVNFGIEYVIRPMPEINGFDAVRLANIALRELYYINFEIGEPIIVSEIFKTLKSVEQVLDVVKIDIVTKVGGLYSGELFDIKKNKSRDGRMIRIPETHIFEIKYPNIDIVGTAI